MTTLTDYAHSLGLAMFGKNPDDTGDSYAADMLDVFDGVITEQCNEHSTCSLLNGYLAAGKPVLDAEYQPSSYPGFCAYDNAHGIKGALFDLKLVGGTFKSCWDSSSPTPHSGAAAGVLVRRPPRWHTRRTQPEETWATCKGTVLISLWNGSCSKQAERKN